MTAPSKSRAFAVAIMVIALIVLLVWKFWPAEIAQPVDSLPRETPLESGAQLRPAPGMVVDTPVAAPVAPSANYIPGSAANNGASNGLPAPVIVKDAVVDKNGVLNFGEVEFSSGVPVQLLLTSGRRLNINPMILAGGNLQLDTEIVSADGLPALGEDGNPVWGRHSILSRNDPINTDFSLIGIANDSLRFIPRWPGH